MKNPEKKENKVNKGKKGLLINISFSVILALIISILCICSTYMATMPCLKINHLKSSTMFPA